MDRSRWQQGRTRAARAVAAHRRPLAALLAAGAVVTGVQAARPDAPATRAAMLVVRDLPAGHVLEAADVRAEEVPAHLLPDGATAPGDLPLGRPVAAAMRSGELLTDLSIVSPTALEGHPEDTVLATVRITDPAATATVAVGDRVSVIAADLRATGPAAVVARRVLVVSLPRGSDTAELGQGRPVVLAVDERTALALAAAAIGSALSLVVTD